MGRYARACAYNVIRCVLSLGVLSAVSVFFWVMARSAFTWGNEASIQRFQNGIVISWFALTVLCLLWWLLMTIKWSPPRSFAETRTFRCWLFFASFALVASGILFAFFPGISDDSGRLSFVPCVFAMCFAFQFTLVAFPPVNVAKVIFPQACGFVRVVASVLCFGAGYGIYYLSFLH